MLSVNELVWHSSISQLDWWTLFEKNQISKISFWCRVIQEPLVQWLHITFPRIYTKSLSYREPQSIQTTRVNTVHFKTINVKHKYFETFKNIFPSKRDIYHTCRTGFKWTNKSWQIAWKHFSSRPVQGINYQDHI